MSGLCPSHAVLYFRVEVAAMKTVLWLGAPSIVTFLASVFSSLFENIHFFFLLSAVAMLVAILPQLSEAKARH